MTADRPAYGGLPRVVKAAGSVKSGFWSSSRWISAEVGWKRVADLTADDCRTLAAQYELLTEVAGAQRRWFHEAADAIEARGARTLADVAGELEAPIATPKDALPAVADGTI